MYFLFIFWESSKIVPIFSDNYFFTYGFFYLWKVLIFLPMDFYLWIFLPRSLLMDFLEGPYFFFTNPRNLPCSDYTTSFSMKIAQLGEEAL